MENKNEKNKSPRWPRIGSVADRSVRDGIINNRLHYDADSWAAVMVHAEQIILRGNAVRAVNIAGQFKVTELVMK